MYRRRASDVRVGMCSVGAEDTELDRRTRLSCGSEEALFSSSARSDEESSVGDDKSIADSSDGQWSVPRAVPLTALPRTPPTKRFLRPVWKCWSSWTSRRPAVTAPTSVWPAEPSSTASCKCSPELSSVAPVGLLRWVAHGNFQLCTWLSTLYVISWCCTR